MSHAENSSKAILFALFANLGIAITKTIAAIFTGSGSMLAESIHSYADCINQLLLFLGLREMKKRPDSIHPLGYGKEIYFWSFIVALILFSMGGLFSIYEGIHKLGDSHDISHPYIAVIVLTISILLESFSLYGCLREVNKIRRNDSLWQWFKNSRQSELVVVFGEDVAALAGLVMALIAVLLAWMTGNAIYDALGSISIGVLLVLISIFLAVKIKSLLIGQSADLQFEADVRLFLNNNASIEKVLSLISIQLGPKVMLAIKAQMVSTSSNIELITNINDCESSLKKQFPQIQWIFFEPDINK